MENQIVPAPPQPDNEPFKLTQETAQSIKLLIDSVAPYVERNMDASRAHIIQERTMQVEAARQEREAATEANKRGATLTFRLVAGIVTAAFLSSMAFAWYGQWAISEKIIIGMLGFAMGVRTTR